MIAVVVFKACVEAMRNGELIERVSATDKDFRFQNYPSRKPEVQIICPALFCTSAMPR